MTKNKKIKKKKSISNKKLANIKDNPKEKKEKININEIKQILINKKNEILEEIRMQSEYENINEKDIGDEIDDVVQTVEKELKFDISATEKNILNEIEIALKKIETGTYGKCELCKRLIEPKRIKAIPYSRYCIECQKKQHIR
ncbi:MAG: TraR/DksA family transcriptional regulator [Elusimicrobiales bacterium]|nr:TraR/DksA family transcriptional regulator [Elusimicrobiales bacterium]